MDVMDRAANVLREVGGIPIATLPRGRTSQLPERELQQAVTALFGLRLLQRSVSRCSLCGRERIVIFSN